jgi:hypothetical protein
MISLVFFVAGYASTRLRVPGGTGSSGRPPTADRRLRREGIGRSRHTGAAGAGARTRRPRSHALGVSRSAAVATNDLTTIAKTRPNLSRIGAIPQLAFSAPQINGSTAANIAPPALSGHPSELAQDWANSATSAAAAAGSPDVFRRPIAHPEIRRPRTANAHPSRPDLQVHARARPERDPDQAPPGAGTPSSA